MGPIVFYLSILLAGLAGLTLLPLFAALTVGEDTLAGLFLIAGLMIATLSGGLIAALRGLVRPLERMHGLLLAIVAWPVLAVAAALPFVISGAADLRLAVFETLSALTTTGFTTFAAPQELPAALILWRAVLQWYGGFLTLLMLVLVLAPVLGPLAGQDRSSLAVAAATLAAAATFHPLRRGIQDTVDRRFNRRRYDAARTIQTFSARLREQPDLDTQTRELLTVVEQTMQPTYVALWLPPAPGRSVRT